MPSFIPNSAYFVIEKDLTQKRDRVKFYSIDHDCVHDGCYSGQSKDELQKFLDPSTKNKVKPAKICFELSHYYPKVTWYAFYLYDKNFNEICFVHKGENTTDKLNVTISDLNVSNQNLTLNGLLSDDYYPCSVIDWRWVDENRDSIKFENHVKILTDMDDKIPRCNIL